LPYVGYTGINAAKLHESTDRRRVSQHPHRRVAIQLVSTRRCRPRRDVWTRVFVDQRCWNTSLCSALKAHVWPVWTRAALINAGRTRWSTPGELEARRIRQERL